MVIQLITPANITLGNLSIVKDLKSIADVSQHSILRIKKSEYNKINYTFIIAHIN